MTDLASLPNERVASGVRIYDATDAIVRMYPRRRSRAAVRPKGQEIDALFVHHSGALGQPGLGGLLAAVRFVMQQREEKFPGSPYHHWFPFRELRDEDGCAVMFRAAEDSFRAWHTGAVANDRGIGLAFQGNLTRSGPSPFQVELFEAFVPWFSKRHSLPWASIRSWLGWHSNSARWGGRPKATCPGPKMVAFLEGYLDRAAPPV